MPRGTSKAGAAAVTSNEEEQPQSQESGTNNVSARVSKDEALKQSYAEATKSLRTKYLSEFNDLRKQVMKDLGYEWTPPPTAEEQAKATIEQLIADNPGLAEVYRKVEQAEDGAEEVPQEGA